MSCGPAERLRSLRSQMSFPGFLSVRISHHWLSLGSSAPQKATAEAVLQWEMVSPWQTVYVFLVKPQSRLISMTAA